jgi:hypothetical protein
VVPAFRLAALADLDEQFNAWLAEAYQVSELPCIPKEEHRAQFTRTSRVAGRPPGLPSERSPCPSQVGDA